MDTRELVTEKLIELPGTCLEAERKVATLQAQLADVRWSLDTERARLLTATNLDGSPIIDGKNAEIRESQLRERLKMPLQTEKDLQGEISLAQAELHHVQSEISCTKALAYLLASENSK